MDKINLIQVYNYRLLETILLSLRKYWAFTLNMEDYDEVFQLGKQGVLLRPTKEELAHDIIHKLSRWSGLPVDYLYGERQIITGLFLTKPFDNTKGHPLWDDRVAQAKGLSELDDLWGDPFGLDELAEDVEAYTMNALIGALVFRLKRGGQLGKVPTLDERKNRQFQEPTPQLCELADALLIAVERKLAEHKPEERKQEERKPEARTSGERKPEERKLAEHKPEEHKPEERKPEERTSEERKRKVKPLEQALAVLHYGVPFEKLVCKLAVAKR